MSKIVYLSRFDIALPIYVPNQKFGYNWPVFVIVNIRYKQQAMMVFFRKEQRKQQA